MKRFILPDIKFNKKNPPVSGVYKMIFDDKYFYIGSSVSLMQRMWRWKFILQTGEKKNYLIAEKFAECKEVRFEVLERLGAGVDPKIREDYYIKESWGDSYLLNRSNDAFVNKARKTKEQIEKIAHRQKVAQFDKGGVLIKIYDSIKEAERSIGHIRISRCFKKYGLSVGGFTFKKIDDNGNFIDPPIVPRTKPFGRQPGTRLSENTKQRLKEKILLRKSAPDYIPPKLPDHTKRVVQYSLSGEFIAEYPSIREAAKAIGLKDLKRLQKLLNGRKGKSCYGFIFKFAES